MMMKIWKNDYVAGFCGCGSVILPTNLPLLVSGLVSQTLSLAVVFDFDLSLITLVVVCYIFLLLQFNG